MLADRHTDPTAGLETPTGRALTQAARAAGLTPSGAGAGADFHGRPTARLSFGEATAPLSLEVSEGFDPNTDPLRQGLARSMQALAGRLRGAGPELLVTMSGLPLRFHGFGWPFHRSTSGSDTLIVHGTVALADGLGSPLHAKISGSMTVTFAEIVAAPEQPYAEDFIYNAIRKTFDYGQLELVKSGNRQPVPVTTRYWSRWRNTFLFTDTVPETRQAFLARKAFWLFTVGGGERPVWLADPRDAQYLNASEQDLSADARALADAGLVSLSADGAYGSATDALKAREPKYREQLVEALASLKPAFNEQMRAGQTNM